MIDVSGFGLVVNLSASNTFPVGFNITEFADDSDPFDFPELKIGERAMGLNGDLITWSVATPIDLTLSVVDGTQSDQNLSIILQANRVGKGLFPARDVITVTAFYPSGKSIFLSNGKMISGLPASAVASSGRIKSKMFKFSFEGKAGAGGG